MKTLEEVLFFEKMLENSTTLHMLTLSSSQMFVFLKKTNAEVLASISPVVVTNGAFNKERVQKEVTFSLDDPENTENVLLSFNALKRKGILSIALNGKSIYDYATTKVNPEPIKIERSLLQRTNTLVFSVDSPGIAFWRKNEYALEQIQITGDVTDVSQQQSAVFFFLTESEYENLEEASLTFIPYCNRVQDVGLLEVFVNGRNIFSAVPICDDFYQVPFSPRLLEAEDNAIVFVTDAGSYTVEQIRLDLDAKPIKSKIYYFDIDPILFLGYEEVVSKVECGAVDGLCPEFCDEDRDIDCCFLDGPSNFWCDVETDDADDRCVSIVDEAKCSRCPSGYEDEDGDPAEACEGFCGDDTDDFCPSGCDLNYDEDCCFENNEDNYWCEDVPVTGLSSVCETSISSGECDDCAFGYRTKTNKRLDCATGLQPLLVEELEVLRDDFDVILYIEFVDDGKNKDADLIINGRRTNIDQDRPFYSRDISNWVRGNTNYIEIIPVTDLNIVEMEIRLE